MMKVFRIIFINLIFLLSLQSYASVMQGGIAENTYSHTNCVIDKNTNTPISGATIKIPQANYVTTTDSNGYFHMPKHLNPNTILSVEKENYRPFSITINERNIERPLQISIEKSNKFDIIIDTNIHHIGDNNYSMSSANAYEFRSRTSGPVYRKSFYMPASSKQKQNYLVIGSIIGIDTALARKMGQNNITTAYATPPSIYFNGKKIAEIQINGDNQRIKIPTYLIRPNQENQIKISAGINLQQTAYIDFDDIEFMNLNIE